MLGGGADLAVVAETPIARTILEAGQLKVVACISQSSQDLAIVARKDKGISSPADLGGKVIGYTKGTTGHFFLDTYCLVNRIHLDGARLVDLSPVQLSTALIEGRVDAVSTWQPYVVALTDALGPQAVVFRDEVIYSQSVFIVARPEFIREHPAQAKLLLEGLSAALDTIAQVPAEAREILGTYLKVDPALVAKVFSARDFNLRLDQSHLLSIENECRWFVDSGAVSRRAVPDVLPFFHLPGLLAVRPQAVQIIRDETGDRP
jgi:NitT/TauT family transport system substrate-binding protein